jgi:TolA-binding protein
MQEDVDFRFQEQGTGKARPRQARPAADPAPTGPVAVPAPPPPSRRSDVFDPNANPNAPGAPRPLGSIPAPPDAIAGERAADGDETGADVGVPGGRMAGAPLDLSTLADRAAGDPSLGDSGAPSTSGALPPPPPRNLSATGAQHAMLPPNATPKDEYDLAYGYLLRKDYALAESSFRDFLR